MPLTLTYPSHIVMKNISIQPKQHGSSLPYPYHIEKDGAVGRQDFWNGNPARLVGFSEKPKAGNVDLELAQFIEKPELAISMFPVFEKSDGSWYTDTNYIAGVHINK